MLATTGAMLTLCGVLFCSVAEGVAVVGEANSAADCWSPTIGVSFAVVLRVVLSATGITTARPAAAAVVDAHMSDIFTRRQP